MALTFYRYFGDSRKLNKVMPKDPEPKTVSTYKLKDDCSVFNPTFIIAYDSKLSPNDATRWANYLVDDSVNRYYFIRDIVRKPNGTLEITCEEDVLMTFKSQIGGLKVIINRSTQGGSDYIPDDKYSMDVRETITTYPFGASFGVSNNPLKSGDDIVICCAGYSFNLS